jgi:hypothetical protein
MGKFKSDIDMAQMQCTSVDRDAWIMLCFALRNSTSVSNSISIFSQEPLILRKISLADECAGASALSAAYCRGAASYGFRMGEALLYN